MLFHQETYSALTRLTVDSYYVALVLSADVLGVDRKIRHRPVVGVLCRAPLHTLCDSVLVRTGECRKYQSSRIGLSFVNFHTRNLFVLLYDCGNIRKIKTGVDTVRIHIERESDYIHVTRTLAVAEQSSLYSVSACQNTQFTVCNRTTSVIVRVQRYNEVLSVNQALAHILDLTCIDVRHRHRYRYGQVDNDFLFGGRLPYFDNLVANISRKLHFRTRKRLGRILEQILSFCLSSIFHTEFCSEFCNVYNLFLGLFEHLFTLSVRRGIVEMHNSPLDAL